MLKTGSTGICILAQHILIFKYLMIRTKSCVNRQLQQQRDKY